MVQAADNVVSLKKGHGDIGSRLEMLGLSAHPISGEQKTAGEMLLPYFVQMLPSVYNSNPAHDNRAEAAAALAKLNGPEMPQKKNRIAQNPELVRRIHDVENIARKGDCYGDPNPGSPQRLDLRIAILEVALGLPYRPNNYISASQTGETPYSNPPDPDSFNQRLNQLEAASGLESADWGPPRAGRLKLNYHLPAGVSHSADCLKEIWEQSGEVLPADAPPALIAQRKQAQQSLLAEQRLKALEKANGLTWYGYQPALNTDFDR